ncbi:ATP-binding cassette domain-containing protein [Hazenella sp. IB182357]|uniref:ATP-binding cassette domain-containing protein n=1 Tax=Polycladospora coralii TaxID=2771432 RepID=A0A926N6J6_9BACL|nr:ATP-binding cassette domain-containing protein [Polycladospora coralii]MBD1372221.1 ATP-binding cassette domain-containing protein [Polycladospora coralii]
MIEVRDLSKSFKIYETKKGAFGTLRSVFSKKYTLKEAVKNISFTINQGECVGYLGPNGAGKSTTIKILSGILYPSGGTITVMGKNPQIHRKQLASCYGVVFGQRSQLWWDLPLRDSYEILREMYKVDKQKYETFLMEYDRLLEIGSFIDTPVRKLSLGQRMRADLAAALIHDPAILFLDEPTIGLDVVGKKRMREFLLHLREDKKKTIVLTTHDMDDISFLCNRVILINHGQMMMDTTLNDLQKKIRLPSKIHLTYQSKPYPQSGSIYQIIEQTDNELTLAYDRSVIKVPELLALCSEWGEIIDIQMREPDIEEIMQNLYEFTSKNS